jgi:hypothetical protein
MFGDDSSRGMSKFFFSAVVERSEGTSCARHAGSYALTVSNPEATATEHTEPLIFAASRGPASNPSMDPRNSAVAPGGVKGGCRFR